MANILDRSETYLRIFTENFEIDGNLPKWKKVSDKDVSEINSAKGTPSNTYISFNKKKSTEKKSINTSEFLSWSIDEFNIHVSERLKSRLDTSESNIFVSTLDGVLLDEADYLEKQKPWLVQQFNRLTKKFKKNLSSKKSYELDILSFFGAVKATSKESGSKYTDRIEPYLMALKQATEAGQTALADSLLDEIFVHKYESLLRSEGYGLKISETQIVDFIKKSEKGLQLCYIKNFIRPIPKEVFEEKKKVDQLCVFDNYCILHYDPQEKSYKQTKAEQEALRRKKADPILFGMIRGSHDLYYITDWTDKYCDLTLKEFLKVSKITEGDIEIPEKIEI